MIKMWRGIKAIFKWGQLKKKIPVKDKDDSEEYSFLFNDDNVDDYTQITPI